MSNNLKVLRILFICYWGLEDVLTQSTVLPRLKVLQEFDNVESIVLVTVERKKYNRKGTTIVDLDNVKHLPYCTGTGYINKALDFILLPFKLVKAVEHDQINVILAHGAPAGALAYKVWESIKLPFYVSSFEPHADYMSQSGVWRWWGIKYSFQKYWERQQKQYATGLMPVSEHYMLHLMENGIAVDRLRTVQSIVKSDNFKYDADWRVKVRNKLNWQTATIGIYSGKYGGLYYNDEAFHIYHKCFDLIPDFRLIILSPQPKEGIVNQLNRHNIEPEKVFVSSVALHQVPTYLAAADFAFATYKPGPSKKYLSPVKIGEYWANGLPVLLTEGVGDESDIIREEGGGALFNLQKPGNLEQAIKQILAIVKEPAHRQEIPKLAVKYRSPERVREAYEYFFNQLQQSP